MHLDNHPIQVAKELTEKYEAQEPYFRFAEYRFERARKPTQTEGDVDAFRIPATFVTETFLDNYLGRHLDPSCNMALCSNVILNATGETKHIGMIDFAEGLDESGLWEAASALHEYGNFQFYSTGRSFHAYLDRLLSQDEWRQFMGDLLLLNQKDEEPIVDWRWVGHKMKRGHAALRWSANGNYYKAMPAALGSEAPLVVKQLDMSYPGTVRSCSNVGCKLQDRHDGAHDPAPKDKPVLALNWRAYP